MKTLPLSPLLRRLVSAVLCLTALFVLSACASRSSAPLYDPDRVLRLPATSTIPEVIIISERNNLHANQARVKLLVGAGALQETDDQLGLAHFVEHMAFRGTTAFPEERLQVRMREMGIQLGRHSNAYTTFDHTAYWLDLNDLNRGQLANSLEILAQWAYDIEFAEHAVQEEMAVIVEEWRLYQQDQDRVQPKIQQAIFNGSRQLQRLAILGDRASIEATDAAKLRHFYQQWYHPENMAVVVTGDVNAEETLALVRQFFERPELDSERLMPTTYDIQPDTIPKYLVLTDPYTQVAALDFTWFVPTIAYNQANERQALARTLAMSVLEDRLASKRLSSNGVVVGANTNEGRVSANIDTLGMTLVLTEPDFALAYEHLQHERLRLLALGISEQEWQTQVASWQAFLQNDQDSPGYLATLAKDYWLYQDPILNASSHQQRLLALLQDIRPAEGVRALAQATRAEPLTLVLHPFGTDAPTITDLAAHRQRAEQLPFAPLVDGKQPDWQPLSPTLGVLSQTAQPEGITEWQLANGIKAYHRYSDGMPDRVFVRLTANNGTNQLADEEVVAARLASELIRDGGQAGLNSSELAQWRQALDIHTNFYIDFYDRSFYLEAPLASLELGLMDLHHRLLDQPLDAELWQFNQAQTLQYLQQMQQHPHVPWIDAYNATVYQNNIRQRMLTSEEVAAATLAQAQAFHQRWVQGNQGYQVAIVGDLSADDALTLVERFFANLPEAVAQGEPQELAQPQQSAQVSVPGSGEEYATIILSHYLDKALLPQGWPQTPTTLLTNWLDEQLFDQIRTQSGLVYSISASIDFALPVDAQFSLDIMLQTDPVKVDDAIAQVQQLLLAAAEQVPTQQQVDTWQQSLADERLQSRQRSDWLLNRIGYSQVAQAEPWHRIAPVTATVQAEQLPALLTQILQQGHLQQLVWLP